MENLTVSTPVDTFMQSTTEQEMRTSLQLGTISTQNADAVAITGGAISGLTSLQVDDNSTLGSSNTDTVTFNGRIASEFTPATDNTYDLGRTGHEWRNLYLDGTANIDSLVADTADINGDLTVTGAGNVGIGTSPAAPLHIERAGDASVWLADTTAGSNYGGFISGRSVAFQGGHLDLGTIQNGAEVNVITINHSHNVGIGTTAPTARLEITGPLTTSTINQQWNLFSGVSAAIRCGSDAHLDFGTTTSHATHLMAGGTRYLSVAATGNVGINDTTPSYKLDVNGTFRNTGALWNDDSINLNRNGAGYIRHRYIDQPLLFGVTNTAGTLYYPIELNAASDYVRFTREGGAETMRIDSSGNVLIGATSLPSGSNDAWGFDRTNSIVKISRSTTGAASQMRFYNPNGEVGSISTSGSATAFNTSSDYRLKENVVPMSDSLQRIGNLKPSRFNFISDDKRIVDGFIAHEVEEVVPEAISGEKDAMRDEEYEVTPAVLDDDGNEVTPAVMGTRSVPEYQGIDQSKLVPLLVGALQELTARLEALENN